VLSFFTLYVNLGLEEEEYDANDEEEETIESEDSDKVDGSGSLLLEDEEEGNLMGARWRCLPSSFLVPRTSRTALSLASIFVSSSL